MYTHKKISFPFIIFTFALALTACSGNGGSPLALASPTPAPPTETSLPPTVTSVPQAASVNGEIITLDDFNAELARYKASAEALHKTVTDEEAQKTVLDDLISQVLLAQGAAETGFTVDDAAVQTRMEALTAQVGGADALKAWQQVHGYTDEAFRAALKRAVSAAWMRDKIISSVPNTAEQVHVRQILLYNEDVAQNYYNQLQAGADFETLAAQVDPVTRGDIGWFPRGYLEEKSVEDAAFALEVGAVSQVIKSAVGFHILKLLDKQADRPLSPDAALALQNLALNDWLAARRQQSQIVLSLN